jgi:AraC-like DNA-binding protein
MIEEVYRSLVTHNNRLLEDPYVPHPMSLDFVEKTYCNDPLLAPALLRTKVEHMAGPSENMGIIEKLHEILQKLLFVHRQVLQDMRKLSALRTSTKAELYKRVQIGHDYMSAYYGEPITLALIAEVACLSPNHFLRCYKQLFGLSPHQFLIEKRLQEAQKLLLKTDKSVTEICFEVGFQSLGSFSWLFSKRFAISPSQFRPKK